jgi:hypothetical protein
VTHLGLWLGSSNRSIIPEPLSVEGTGAIVQKLWSEEQVWDIIRPLTIRILGPDDGQVLDRVAREVFDNAVDRRWTTEFLTDSRRSPRVNRQARTSTGVPSRTVPGHHDRVN